MADIHTGGGGVVGGDARSGKDFVGRDQYNHDNITNIKLGEDDDRYTSRQQREGKSLYERVQDMERYLYGDERAGEPGLIMQNRTRLIWSQFNTVLLGIILLMVAKLMWG